MIQNAALSQKTSYEEISRILRSRICLHVSDETFLLREGKIAEEFGISRTPVRQVLQQLAHERLVETRAGIGTMATPLEEGMFGRDLQTTASILRGCALACVDPIPTETRFALLGLNVWAKENHDSTEPHALYLETYTKLLAHLVPLITDPLLAHAYSSAFWRIIRWRTRQYATDPQSMWVRLSMLIDSALIGIQSGEKGGIFLQLSKAAQDASVQQQQSPGANTQEHAPDDKILDLAMDGTSRQG